MKNIVEDITENGRRYRIILEPPSIAHPEGWIGAAFTGEHFKEKIWEQSALPDETDAHLRQTARVQVQGHASKR